MNTLQKFNVGDVITCLNIDPLKGNDVAPPLAENNKYTVLAIVKDAKGYQHLDVGLKSQYNFIRSAETGEHLPNGDKIHWCHPSRFYFPDGE